MDIQKAALGAEIVGGVGVVISLIFVGLQVRDSAAAAEAQAVLDLRQSMAELQRDLAATPELPAFLFRAYEDPGSLQGADYLRFQQWVGNVVNTYVAAYEFGRLGLVSDEEFASWGRGICGFLSRRGARVEWDRMGQRAWPRPDFRTWAEGGCGIAGVQ